MRTVDACGLRVLPRVALPCVSTPAFADAGTRSRLVLGPGVAGKLLYRGRVRLAHVYREAAGEGEQRG
jgi:hypothetical protein